MAVSPNPSCGGAVVEFMLTTRGEVSLKVCDAQRRLVRTMVSGIREAGT